MINKVLSVTKYVVLMIVVLSVVTACFSPKKETPAVTAPLGELNYEVIDISSPSFDAINKDDLADWYKSNSRKEGIHSFTQDTFRYLLISAGEKPTGGFSIENLHIVGTEANLDITASLKTPGQGEMVTQALTYPHLLVKINEDERQLRYEGLKTPATPEAEKNDSGIYQGRIDSNSVEIKISGVPNELSIRAFQLSDELKDTLENKGLQAGDTVIFTYLESSNRPTITKIELLKN